MGVQLELPVPVKKRTLDLYMYPRASEEPEYEVCQWGAVEKLSIDDAMTQLVGIGRSPTDVSTESPSSSKRLISASVSPGSSSPQSFSTSSPPFHSGCADPFGGKASSHQRLKKKSEEEGRKPLACACNGDFQPSRWDSGRWMGASFDNDKKRGRSFCKSAAGLTADVAAVCCCPLSLLHLLAIAFIKLPSALLARAITKIKRKMKRKRKRSPSYEEDDDSIPASSFPPSRCRSYEAGDIQTWAPALGFGDQRLWKDYFDSPDTGVWNNGDPQNISKS